MPHPDSFFNHADGVRVGDIVTCEGMSAIRGEVTEIGEDGVTVRWMEVQTTEAADDLIRLNVKPPPSEKFLSYVREGQKLIEQHPDLGPEGIDYWGAASDQIANILHGMFDGDREPQSEVLASGKPVTLTPVALLDHALTCYQGDQEDR